MRQYKEFNGDPELSDIYHSLRKNLIQFGKFFFPHLFTLPSPPFHHEVAKHLISKSLTHLNIIAPRGHAKSTLALLLALHHLAYDQGQKHIVLISKTLKHSTALLGLIKEAIDNNPHFQQLYGNFSQDSQTHPPLKWREDEIILADNSRILCLGTGQQARGLTYKGQRPTLIIFDDPEDENNTRSDIALEHNRKYLLQGMEPALDSECGRIIIIGTPMHYACIVMTLQEMTTFKTLFYTAEDNPDTQTPLWPEKFSWEKLQNKKQDLERIGRLSYYYQEYCCQIIPDDTALFQPSDARFYTGTIKQQQGKTTLTLIHTDRTGTPLPKATEKTIPVDIYTGIDPAVSTSLTADYSAIVSIAIDPDNNRYVLPYFQKRVQPHILFQSIIATYKKLKPKRTSIESTAAQETLRDFLHQLSDISIPGISTKHQPKEKKEKRHIDLLQPYFAQHKVLIQPQMKSLYEQLITHPHSKNDDLIDALYYAFLHAKPPTRKHSHTHNNNNTTQSHSWLTA